jgi:superoxide dismutase
MPSPKAKTLSNHWITLHQEGIPAGFKPLLVMDVWEDAFMRDVEQRLREEAAVRPAA